MVILRSKHRQRWQVQNKKWKEKEEKHDFSLFIQEPEIKIVLCAMFVQYLRYKKTAMFFPLVTHPLAKPNNIYLYILYSILKCLYKSPLHRLIFWNIFYTSFMDLRKKSTKSVPCISENYCKLWLENILNVPFQHLVCLSIPYLKPDLWRKQRSELCSEYFLPRGPEIKEK